MTRGLPRRGFTWRFGAGWAWVVGALCLLVAPWVWPDRFALALLTQMGIAILACLSYHVLLGQGGMMSFGHAVYTGAGAYLAIHTLNAWGLLSHGTAPLWLPLVGGLAGLLVAWPLGWLSTRSAGTPFAMVTLGLGELVWATALAWPAVFGGEAGVSGNRAAAPAAWVDWGSPLAIYHLVAVYTALGLWAVLWFTQTSVGRLLNAARDNPLRLSVIGHDPRRVRFVGFAFAAFWAGVSGGLAALHFEIVTPEVFAATRSGALLLFVFLGGSGSPFGAVIGGVVMAVAMVWGSELSRAWVLYLGLLFVWAVLFAPQGLAGLWQGAWTGWRSPEGRLQFLQRLRSPWPWARGAGMALALGGAVALVEMLYHLRLSDTLGNVLHWAGLALDVDAPADWMRVVSVACAGAVLWVCGRRPGSAR